MTIAPAGLYRVRKAFTAGDKRLPAGEIVDVTGWRNAYQLVDRGYLVAAPDAARPPAKKAAAKKAAAKKAPAKRPVPKIED